MVGKVVVVTIVLSVGCSWCSWRRVSAQHVCGVGLEGTFVAVAAVRVAVVHVVPWVEAAAVYAVLTVIAVVPVWA